MCVIAISPIGVKQPTEKDLHSMWQTNSHGGGYMTVRNGKVEIHKGFMEWADFIRSIRSEKFTTSDPVIYHFRISTQGGVNPEMTHPFPLTSKEEYLKALDVSCDIGIAHNGIIPLTTVKTDCELSDTALFIKKYMVYLIRSQYDILNPNIQRMIEELGKSKFAIMNGNGDIATIGKFHSDNGILLSNTNHWFDWRTYYTGVKGAKENVLCTPW